MPSNDDFSFKVLIGETPVAEFQLDGIFYIECNLSTAISYKQSLTEIVSGEVESQEFPVTPYEVEIEASSQASCANYYRVFVDGIKIKGLSIEPGDKRLVKGFRDGAVIRELLFSMPRFAKNESDRLSYERLNKVGQIEVECWEAELKTTEWKVRKKALDFTQANKKDSYGVTNGQFTMATSKAGRAVCSRRLFRCVDNWKRKGLKSRLCVLYRMSHELVEMGFALQPLVLRKLPASDQTSAEGNKQSNEKSSCKTELPTVKLETDVKEHRNVVSDGEPPCIDLTSDDEGSVDVVIDEETVATTNRIDLEEDRIDLEEDRIELDED